MKYLKKFDKYSTNESASQAQKKQMMDALNTAYGTDLQQCVKGKTEVEKLVDRLEPNQCLPTITILGSDEADQLAKTISQGMELFGIKITQDQDVLQELGIDLDDIDTDLLMTQCQEVINCLNKKKGKTKKGGLDVGGLKIPNVGDILSNPYIMH